MRKEWKLLLPVMILAIVVTAALYTDLLRDRKTVSDLLIQLEASRSAWETTAEEKEKLQEELKTVEEALKEAKLTLSESNERAEKLKVEIAQLREETGEAEPQGNDENHVRPHWPDS